MRQTLTRLCIVATILETVLFASCQQESDEIIGNINGLGLEG